MQRLLASLLSLALVLSTSGCALGPKLARNRVRILAASGAGAMVAGGVVASGCDFDESGCSSRSPPDLAVGISLIAVGGVLLGTALLVPNRPKPLFQPPPPSPPNPALPAFPLR